MRGTPDIYGSIIVDAHAELKRFGTDRGAGDINYDVYTNFNAITERALVVFEMTPEGTDQLSSLTGANIHKYLAIVLDSSVYSARRIIRKISNGRIEITGKFNFNEAKQIARRFNTGTLPAHVHIVDCTM